MAKAKYSKEDVVCAVADNKSMAGVLWQLGLRPVGGNYRTIRRIIDSNGIDTSHFTGQGWNVGLVFKPNTGVLDQDIFVEKSSYKCSWRLRERYKKTTEINRCEHCGLESWLGQPIPLEIHHINGINTDNRLENLQLLCPNCHALTLNYRGRARLK
jgi:5-methylcytosine-specific restriction endonuclease McrA